MAKSTTRGCLPTDGDFAQSRRIAAGLTQEELADKAEITTKTISSIENGRGASLSSLKRFAEVVGVDWRSLLESELRELLMQDIGVRSTVSEPHLGLHRLSGRWDIRLTCQKWRGREITDDESVVVYGLMDLWLPQSGDQGVGVALGELHIQLSNPLYSSTMRVVDKISRAYVDQDKLHFRSKTFTRDVLEQSGEPPVNQPGLKKVLPNGTIFTWTFTVDADNPRHLVGNYGVLDGNQDAAIVNAKRLTLFSHNSTD